MKKKYHVIRVTKGTKRGRWAVARAIDSWVDGTLDLMIMEDEDQFTFPEAAKVRADELERNEVNHDTD